MASRETRSGTFGRRNEWPRGLNTRLQRQQKAHTFSFWVAIWGTAAMRPTPPQKNPQRHYKNKHLNLRKSFNCIFFYVMQTSHQVAICILASCKWVIYHCGSHSGMMAVTLVYRIYRTSKFKSSRLFQSHAQVEQLFIVAPIQITVGVFPDPGPLSRVLAPSPHRHGTHSGANGFRSVQFSCICWARRHRHAAWLCSAGETPFSRAVVPYLRRAMLIKSSQTQKISSVR